MAETGVERADDGSVVLTTIFQPGELSQYLDTSAAGGEAAPVEQGAGAPTGEHEPAAATDAEQPSADAGPPEGDPSLQGPPYTSGDGGDANAQPQQQQG